jgi:hypothetical protein
MHLPIAAESDESQLTLFLLPFCPLEKPEAITQP